MRDSKCHITAKNTSTFKDQKGKGETLSRLHVPVIGEDNLVEYDDEKGGDGVEERGEELAEVGGAGAEAPEEEEEEGRAVPVRLMALNLQVVAVDQLLAASALVITVHSMMCIAFCR